VSDRIVVLVAGEVALDGYADTLDRATIVTAFIGADTTPERTTA